MTLYRTLQDQLRKPRARLVVVVLHFALFYIAFFLLHSSLGLTISMLGIIPVIVGAWYFGMWTGALLALGVHLVDNLISIAMGWGNISLALEPAGLLGLMISIVIALIVGRVGEITRRRQAQIAQHLALLEERQLFARFLSLLNDILCAALEREDMSAMLSELVSRTGELFHADACYITFWDEKTRKTIPMSAYGPLSEVYTQVHRFMPEERTLTAVVMDTGRAVPVEDIKTTPLLTNNVAEEFPNRAALGLPLIAGDWKLGALILGYDHAHTFSTGEIERGELAARGISLAVTKALLLKETRQRVLELSGLHDLSQVFSMRGDARQTFSQLNEILARLMEVPICLTCLKDPATGELKVQLPAFGLDDAQSAGLTCPLPSGSAPAGDDSSEIRYLNSAQDFPPNFQPAASACRIENLLIAPLADEGRNLLGSLLLANRPGGFSEGDVRLIEVFSRQVVIVIQNTRLLDTERKQADELATIQAVADAASEARDENRLIERVTQLIGEKLYSDNFGVLLIAEKTGQLFLHSSYHLAAHEMPVQVPPEDAVTGVVARSGKPRRVDDVSVERSHVSLYPLTRSGLCVPLQVDKVMLGVVNAESTRINGFTAEDEELLTIIASQLATSIQRLRMRETEERQRMLLSRSNRMVKALAEIGARAAAASDLGGIVQNLGNELGKLGFSCLIALAEEDGAHFHLSYTSLPGDTVLKAEELLGFKMAGFPLTLDILEGLDQPGRRVSLIKDIRLLVERILPMASREGSNSSWRRSGPPAG